MDELGVAGNVYFEKMEKVADGQHLEDVITAKAKAEEKAVKLFKTSTSDCNQDLVKERENKLDEAIQLKHGEFERLNKNRLESLLQELSNLANECRMGYVDIMEEESKKEETVEYFRAAHQQARESCLEKFNGSEIGKGYKCKEQQLKCLEDGISECFQGYENGILQKAMEEKRQKNEKEKQHLFSERKLEARKYEDAFKNFKEKYVEEDKLDKIHETNKQQALKAFDANRNNVSTEALKSFSENKNALERDIEDTFVYIKGVNKENEEKAERIIQLFCAKVSVEYLETMNKVGKHGSDKLVDAVHDMFVLYIKHRLEKKVIQKKLQEQAINLCNCMFVKQKVKVYVVQPGWFSFTWIVGGIAVAALTAAITAVVAIAAAAAAAAAVALAVLAAPVLLLLVAVGIVVTATMSLYTVMEELFNLLKINVVLLPSLSLLDDLNSLLY